MAVTELKRKDRRNHAVSRNRLARIKELLWKPEIKVLDIEELKAKYAAMN